MYMILSDPEAEGNVGVKEELEVEAAREERREVYVSDEAESVGLDVGMRLETVGIVVCCARLVNTVPLVAASACVVIGSGGAGSDVVGSGVDAGAGVHHVVVGASEITIVGGIAPEAVALHAGYGHQLMLVILAASWRGRGAVPAIVCASIFAGRGRVCAYSRSFPARVTRANR
jgi:hypothetical protein